MKMMNRLWALALALLMCLSCAAAESTDVMATVNGTDITRGTFDAYLANLTSYYEYYGYDVTAEENVAELKVMALSTLIQLALMDQKLVEMNIALTDEEKADAAQEGRELWAEDVNNAMSYRGATDADSEEVRAAILVQVLAELETLGYTEQSYIDEAVESALYIKLENEMVKAAAVTDAEVESYYSELVQAQQEAFASDAASYEYVLQMNEMALMLGYSDYYTDLYYMPEGYRCMTHILLPVDEGLLNDYLDLQAAYEELEEGTAVGEDAVTAEELENARLAVLASVQAKVDEITAKLAEGTAFADLIPLYTADTAMDSAAEISAGLNVHMDSISHPAGYRDAAFSLENTGDVSAPFVSDGGVYIVCYIGDVTGGPVQLTDDMREVLRMELLESAQAEIYTATMNSWVAASTITYSDEAAAFMGE